MPRRWASSLSKAKVAQITEDEQQYPVVRVELIEEGSSVVERVHDLVVLSGGMLPAYDPRQLYHVPISADGFAAIPSPNLSPCMTDQPGIFVTGTAAGPMDIVDSIVMASAAAAETAAYLARVWRTAWQHGMKREDWSMPDDKANGVVSEVFTPATAVAISAMS